MESNFLFLENEYPVLSRLGYLAEAYLYTDPNSCLVKLGMLAENIVGIMMKLDGLTVPPELDDTNANRIRTLKKNNLLPVEIDNILYSIRKTRNVAAHENYESAERCKVLLQMAWQLSLWFMQTYGRISFKAHNFVMPVEEPTAADYKKLLEQKEAEAQKLAERIRLIEKQAVTNDERAKRGSKNKVNLTEAETRLIIDMQLRQVGWDADTPNLRYSKGARPQKSKNTAIAEWPTDSKVGDKGFADYAFFVGEKLVAITEAKRSFTDIPSVIDNQCKDYALCIKKEHSGYQLGNWGDYKVPFVFATNGRKYLKQLDTKSGIWFLDLRQNFNVARALQGWMSPDGIMQMLSDDVAQAEKKLESTPYDLLTDQQGLNLRYYQVEAIQAAENAIVGGKKTALLSMATGTGKTRTVIGMIYRFLSTGRFHRILFIVDRNSLGEQAEDFFKDLKIEDLKTLDQIYDIKELGEKEIEPETKIQVATVQSLVKRIMYNEEDKALSVTDYDLIIVDEAHRGYILDKEMSEEEQLYRNQDDYVSKYRTVIEYFDAVKIALTATPALHTTDIFGAPVYTYSYRQAVIDDYLVDHDAPHIIKTELSTNGIKYKKGERMAIYDPVTNTLTNSAELEDEVVFDVEKFNRQVITENFNRVVLTEIAGELNPEGDGKTLIFAVNDNHADLVVKILKEIYAPTGLDNDAIMKITASIYNGNQKKIEEQIRKFKNERYPNIVVTVDLLSTGIDVPPITSIVFLRCIKSRILFEQMLGRATRLCPEINKDHFDIYDAVGVYKTLEPVTNMKPVSADANATFCDLLDGLEVLDDEAFIKKQIDMIIVKLQRRRRKFTEEQAEQFEYESGGKTSQQFVKKLRGLSLAEAREQLLSLRSFFQKLDESGPEGSRPVVVSDKPDALRLHTRGYGDNMKPGDYLDAFRDFIVNNMNEVAALKVVCTSPGNLTRKGLHDLKMELDNKGFTEKQLNSALKDYKNEDYAADIISLVRRYAIGSALLSHEERIKKAVEKLKHSHKFTRMESDWLDRIEKALINETVIDREMFDSGAFKNEGGYNKLNKIFNNNFDKVILELNDYLYEDGGKTA